MAHTSLESRIRVQLPGTYERRLGLPNILFFGSAAMLLVGADAAAMGGHWGTVVMLTFLSLAAIGFGATPWVNQRPGTVTLELGPDGLVVPGTKYAARLLIALWVLSLIGLTLIVSLLMADRQDPTDSPALVSGVALFGALILWLPRSSRRAAPARLTATPDDLRVSSPFHAQVHIPWTALRPLTDGPRPLAHMLTGFAHPPAGYPEEDLAGDPVVVAEIIDFYRRRSDLRFELASSAALDRIERGDFRPAQSA